MEDIPYKSLFFGNSLWIEGQTEKYDKVVCSISTSCFNGSTHRIGSINLRVKSGGEWFFLFESYIESNIYKDVNFELLSEFPASLMYDFQTSVKISNGLEHRIIHIIGSPKSISIEIKDSGIPYINSQFANHESITNKIRGKDSFYSSILNGEKEYQIHRLKNKKIKNTLQINI